MAKRLLTEAEIMKIPRNLFEQYNKKGFVPYFDDEETENEVLWGNESQIIYDKLDKNSSNKIDIPKVHFWAGVHMIYANFLWIVLFVALVVFTILLMMYDFDIHKLYRAIKSIFYDYV